MTYVSANIMPGFNVSTSKYGLMLVLHRDGAGYLPTENDVRQGRRPRRTDAAFLSR